MAKNSLRGATCNIHGSKHAIQACCGQVEKGLNGSHVTSHFGSFSFEKSFSYRL